MLSDNPSIKKIVRSIDRMEISVPLQNYPHIKRCFKYSCRSEGTKHKKKKIIHRYLYKNRRIHIWLYKTQKAGQNNPRFFIELYQPNQETLNFVRKLLAYYVPVRSLAQFNPSISQLEIAHDFILYDSSKRQEFKKHIQQSLHMIHARIGTAGKYEDTDYRGKKGHIHKGSKGFRLYLKRTHIGRVVRLELQLNRFTLRKQKITLDEIDLLSPDKYNLFDYAEFLGDFTEKGLLNIARNIAQKRGINAKNARKYRFRVNIIKHQLRRRVYGTALYEIKKCVTEQIDELKRIKQENKAKNRKVTFNIKNYCTKLTGFTDTILEKLTPTNPKTVTEYSVAGTSTAFPAIEKEIRPKNTYRIYAADLSKPFTDFSPKQYISNDTLCIRGQDLILLFIRPP